jgi:hypothetical protein
LISDSQRPPVGGIRRSFGSHGAMNPGKGAGAAPESTRARKRAELRCVEARGFLGKAESPRAYGLAGGCVPPQRARIASMPPG